MEIKPLSQRQQDALLLPIVVIMAPAWIPLFGAIFILVQVERWWNRVVDPPRWRKVFALWPVECDPWPDDGYSGWVWLETVWRNRNALGWTKYRREAPNPNRGTQ